VAALAWVLLRLPLQLLLPMTAGMKTLMMAMMQLSWR
jgi:hypothetical protein